MRDKARRNREVMLFIWALSNRLTPLQFSHLLRHGTENFDPHPSSNGRQKRSSWVLVAPRACGKSQVLPKRSGMKTSRVRILERCVTRRRSLITADGILPAPPVVEGWTAQELFDFGVRQQQALTESTQGPTARTS